MILKVSIRVEAREMKSARKLRFVRTEYVNLLSDVSLRRLSA